MWVAYLVDLTAELKAVWRVVPWAEQTVETLAHWKAGPTAVLRDGH